MKSIMNLSIGLPQELWDIVIDFLHDDRPALQACYLTCRCWAPAARHHLYHKMQLGFIGLRKWARTFPSIPLSPSKYVRHLVITSEFSIRGSHTPIHSELLDYFVALDHVRMLEIHGGFIKSHTNSSTIQEYFRRLGSKHLTSLTVKSMPLSPHCSEFLRFLCLFPKLDNLAISFTHSAPGAIAADHKYKPKTSPRFSGTFELSHCLQPGCLIIRDLINLPRGLHFRAIKVMDLHMEDGSALGRLLRTCALTLEKLVLHHVIICDYVEGAIDLRNHHRLTSVAVDIFPDCIEWAAPLLCSLPSQISELKLTISGDHRSDWEGKLVHWQEIDDALVRLGEGGRLQVQVYCEAPNNRRRAASSAKALLPMTVASGVLELSEQVPFYKE